MRDNLLLHNVTVYRKQQIEGQGLTSQWVERGKVKCLLLPTDEKDALTKGLTFGKQYQLNAQVDADIQEGDKLVADFGVTVLVDGKAVFRTTPVSDHAEFSCITVED